MNMLGWDKDEYLNTFQIRHDYPLQSHYIDKHSCATQTKTDNQNIQCCTI